MKPRTSVELPCLHCGIKVEVQQYRVPTFKFCSRSCSYHYKAEHDRVHKNCKICGTGFSVISHRETTAKYCSRECYHKGQKGRGSVEHSCAHCGIKFMDSPSKNRKYCSRACNNKADIATWRPTFTTIRKKMEARNMLHRCERCGFDSEQRILGVHHKDRNRENNDLSNLEVLCPNCHSLEHLKHTPHGFQE